jgi:peptidoglycan/xylan/chitin deacetylase (PgdA/CDA1 family)
MRPADAACVPILTYHSISNASGPTTTTPEVFAGQMQEIASQGWSVISLEACASWLKTGAGVTPRSLVITFDDGYQDFADAAFPILQEHGFCATVFVPTQLPGGSENWEGAAAPGRALMTWPTIKTLCAKQISFAAHGRTHADLTTLSGTRLIDEILGPKEDFQDQLGGCPPHFAPPYGRSTPEVRSAIQRGYDLSLGVRFGLAKRSSPMYDLPRVEMYYYRNLARWRDFLAGKGGGYMAARKMARAVRQTWMGA